jgi:hypothetical protein
MSTRQEGAATGVDASLSFSYPPHLGFYLFDFSVKLIAFYLHLLFACVLDIGKQGAEIL